MFSTTAELEVIAFAVACEDVDHARSARPAGPPRRKIQLALAAVTAVSRAFGQAAAMALVTSPEPIDRSERGPRRVPD